jgi:hypothetical protein
MVLLDRQVVYHSRFGGPFDRVNDRAFADGTEQRVTSVNLLGGDPAPPNDPEWMLWCRSDDPPADMKIQERRVILEQVRRAFRDERAFGIGKRRKRSAARWAAGIRSVSDAEAEAARPLWVLRGHWQSLEPPGLPGGSQGGPGTPLLHQPTAWDPTPARGGAMGR